MVETANKPIYATISPTYFTNHPDLVEVLYKDERLYLGIIIEVNSCNCFVPLRTNIKPDDKLKKALFPVPSHDRPNAGLDFRKLLIINDNKYINIQTKVFIPQSQKDRIITKFEEIKRKVDSYVKTYIKEVNRGRATDNHLYKYSTLKNYHHELSLKESRKAVIKVPVAAAQQKSSNTLGKQKQNDLHL